MLLVCILLYCVCFLGEGSQGPYHMNLHGPHPTYDTYCTTILHTGMDSGVLSDPRWVSSGVLNLSLFWARQIFLHTRCGSLKAYYIIALFLGLVIHFHICTIETHLRWRFVWAQCQVRKPISLFSHCTYKKRKKIQNLIWFFGSGLPSPLKATLGWSLF